MLCLGICGVVVLPVALNITTLTSVAEVITKSNSHVHIQSVHFNTTNGEVQCNTTSKENTPEVLEDDLIYKTRSAFVIPEYKLVFFTFPKVACSEWKRMFMRMNGNPSWCLIRGFNAHDPKLNMIKMLQDYDPEVATAMMTSPAWTKAAILREPKERVLSAFLDKAFKEGYYIKHCCENLPNDKLKKQCIDNEKKFDSFIHFVTEYPVECFDVHWEPQLEKIDSKWWPYIDVIGYQSNLLHDSQHILKTLYSNRDEVEGRSAWDRYGVTGWGMSNECENRTHSFLEENTSTHKLDTGSHLLEWYTAETEKVVEEKWSVEWQQEKVKFPEIKLFEN